jgi:uncharacterized repeat protein (TIGR03803 family)
MHSLKFRDIASHTKIPALVILICLLLVAPSLGQNYQVLHYFAGAEGGQHPWGGPTLDRADNIYGTTATGGAGYGDVYKLTKVGSNWVLSILHDFEGDDDGAGPYSPLVIGPDGALYGSTVAGGITDDCCGTVFKLTPPATVCKSVSCPWNETILYRFQGGSDGSGAYGGITFDQAGNIYGTTEWGGGNGCTGPGCGTVFKLTNSHGQWTESVIYRFAGNGDGASPLSTVILDQAGNLYGTTSAGGSAGFGAVYELTSSGSGWSGHILYSFQNGADGRKPAGGLVMDGAGNLYGNTYYGGSGNGGTVYELSPAGGGNWNFNLLYSFTTRLNNGGPWATLIIDSAGTLYGTTYATGSGAGAAYRLTHSNGVWTETDLRDFEWGTGAIAYGSVALDPNGHVYGVTELGGTHNCNGDCGVVWEITQ